MTETNDTPKGFIISLNGEGITLDYLVKYTEDFEVLDAIINKIKKQCIINDNKKQQ
jgi:hypothetical protein